MKKNKEKHPETADDMGYRPTRNCDRFNTADEAHKGFREMCDGIDDCEKCRFYDLDSNFGCEIAWLYAEADKEIPKYL